MWQFACLERDVAEPGQYVVWNLGRESIVASRTQNGELAANYNVCQHRGARIMVDDRGCAERFTCPYHGWSYRPDGRLVVVPDNQRFEHPVDRAERSLKPVRVEAAMGLVFICPDMDAPPLLDVIGPVVDRLVPYDLASMTLIADQTVFLNCNWKAVLDNFHELYHVEHIHPLHALHFDCPTSFVELFQLGHTGVQIHGHTVNTRLPIPDEPPPVLDRALRMFGADPADYRGRVLDVREAVQRLRREAGPRLGWDYDALTDERLSDVEQYNTFPNLMITVQADDALVMRARPHPTDPDWCYWDKFSFHRQPDEAVATRHGVRSSHTTLPTSHPSPGRPRRFLPGRHHQRAQDHGSHDRSGRPLHPRRSGRHALAWLRGTAAVQRRDPHPALPRLVRPVDEHRLRGETMNEGDTNTSHGTSPRHLRDVSAEWLTESFAPTATTAPCRPSLPPNWVRVSA